MKRKGLKVLAAAAVLSIGVLTVNSYAAEGWALSGSNTWVYLDSNGNRMTNVWKRGADNLWRYLNSSGEMAVSTWADGEYYVDSNGIMVTEQWIQTQAEGSRSSETYWFYFASSGKAVKDGWKKIDGKSYLFDSEGAMCTGWSDDGLYYLGDDGAMRTGWKYLEPSEDADDTDGPESDDGKYWYYFASNGKKYCTSTGTSTGDYRVSKIDSKYYCFDEDGRMQTGWVYMTGDSDSAPKDSIEDWRYFAEAGISSASYGAAVTGWLSLEPPEQLLENVDDSVVWYYFEKEGVPKIGPKSGEGSTNDLERIDGKYYLFNQKGNPVSGLHKVQIGTTGEYTSYYFDSSSKTPLKGKRTVEEGDGSKYTYYFSEGTNAGRGVTGVKSNYLYYMGKLQQADSSTKYLAISIPSGSSYETYVVNTSGRIAKNTTVKDGDGNKYKVDSNGILKEINGEAVGSEKFEDPIEPVYEYDD